VICYIQVSFKAGLTIHLRIDRNFCSVHEEITSIRLYTPYNPRSGLRKGAYNLIEVISNEPRNK
jgi:hypothetical protein